MPTLAPLGYSVYLCLQFRSVLELEFRSDSWDKYYIRKEGKRGRGKLRILMIDDIKADESYEKIKRRAMDRECWRNWIPITCFQAEHQWLWWWPYYSIIFLVIIIDKPYLESTLLMEFNYIFYKNLTKYISNNHKNEINIFCFNIFQSFL